MRSALLTETSDTTAQLHSPISASTTTESIRISATPNSIGMNKTNGSSDVDTTMTTTTSHSSNNNEDDLLVSLSLPRVMMNNIDNDETDAAASKQEVLPCTNMDGPSNPVVEDSRVITTTSVLDDEMESMKNQPITNQTNEISFITLCEMKKQETLDTTTTMNSDLEKNNDGNNNNINNEDEEDDGRIRLGICAMDKKARSKPMAEILSRIDEDTYRVVFFGDSVLLNDPPTTWPKCDVLIAFYSKGYPLQKVKEYVKICKPYILNDLDMQEVIQDRRRVYDTLEGSGIDVPRHVYLSRDGYKSTGSGDGNGSNDQDVVEHDDYIVINGITIQKPFVEKPVNAENHNISIYYPTTAGGGCKKLFRKIGNRSSEFYPDINEVRRDGSYIYEEFVETQGTDVKMYTVGPGM